MLMQAVQVFATNPDDPRHGTYNGYNNYGCRCERCKLAASSKQREHRQKRLARGCPPHLHGTATGYQNYGCHCEACSEAYLAPRRTGGLRRQHTARVTAEMWADFQSGMTVLQIAAKWGRSEVNVYHRFKRAGLEVKSRNVSEAAGMYFDYCLGMTIEEVAAKHGCREAAVRQRFHRLGVPIKRQHPEKRPPQRRQPVDPGLTLTQANRRRTELANEQHAAAYRAALGAAVSPHARAVLQARVDNPDATLAELADQLGASKDVVAGVLRRAREGLR